MVNFICGEKNMNIVFKVSDNVKDEMIKYYEDKKKEKVPPYATFQATEADTVVTLYDSGKVMFQGMSADIDANMWKEREAYLNKRNIDAEIEAKKEKDKKKNEKDLRYFNYSAIGSDEIGTGDYLLPIVVCASFVDKNEIMELTDLGIKDSKKLTDDKILKLAPKLIEKLPHEYKILTNKEYNLYKEKDINMNKVKALLHNELLVKMSKKNLDYEKIIVDQFAYPRSYFSYIKDEIEKVTKITFLTKGEDKNLSVACASIIGRYYFLKERDKLSEKYETLIPKGAGIEVDKIAKELVNKYGENVLNEISKISFKNTERVLK